MKQSYAILKTVPLLVIVLIMFSFFYLHLYQYLTFENIRDHRQLFLAWTHEHYLKTVCIYVLLFTIAEATAIPGSTFFTVVGGFLFGTLVAALYAVLSITVGGMIFFMAVKLSLGDWLLKKSGKTSLAIKKWEKGFQDNAFSYLFMLRLFPFIPFWVINAAAGLLGIRFSTFTLATLVGVAPGVILCTSIGHGLDSIFIHNQVLSFMAVFQTRLLLPLFGIAVLAVCPLIYKWLKPKFSRT